MRHRIRPDPMRNPNPHLPLAGVRIVDFTWVAAGPATTRYFADFGATVLRIETSVYPDPWRNSAPFAGNTPGPNRSGAFALVNAGKRSLTLNMRTAEGVGLARRLILEWADAVVDNFTAGVLERWGLGYDVLSRERPDLVMLSMSTFGRGNPLESLPGFGPLITALVGITNLAGWPDSTPVPPGPSATYTDFIVPRQAATALIAALDYRERTGRGVYIPLSQFLASLHLLAPLILDALESGRQAQRQGNRDTGCVPHGCFPCADGEWVAIAVETDAHWRALRQVMGCPAWADDPWLDTVLGRKAREDMLEAHLAQWTRQYPSQVLVQRLQEAGVPAGVCHSARGLLHDPQMAHRGAYPELEHPEIGKHRVDAPEMLLSATPGRPVRPAPLLGQDTLLVLREVLGLTVEEVDALREKGVLQ
ncbi:MAG: CoA transferase [Dehalococcoidia bacterium]|nr:CoA transferase [Dehalococcoidia bacterium]MDW8120144.1 CoA transferase [Chloroflexota bacterium]